MSRQTSAGGRSLGTAIAFGDSSRCSFRSAGVTNKAAGKATGSARFSETTCQSTTTDTSQPLQISDDTDIEDASEEGDGEIEKLRETIAVRDARIHELEEQVRMRKAMAARSSAQTQDEIEGLAVMVAELRREAEAWTPLSLFSDADACVDIGQGERAGPHLLVTAAKPCVQHVPTLVAPAPAIAMPIVTRSKLVRARSVQAFPRYVKVTSGVQRPSVYAMPTSTTQPGMASLSRCGSALRLRSHSPPAVLSAWQATASLPLSPGDAPPPACSLPGTTLQETIGPVAHERAATRRGSAKNAGQEMGVSAMNAGVSATASSCPVEYAERENNALAMNSEHPPVSASSGSSSSSVQDACCAPSPRKSMAVVGVPRFEQLKGRNSGCSNPTRGGVAAAVAALPHVSALAAPTEPAVAAAASTVSRVASSRFDQQRSLSPALPRASRGSPGLGLNSTPPVDVRARQRPASRARSVVQATRGDERERQRICRLSQNSPASLQ